MKKILQRRPTNIILSKMSKGFNQILPKLILFIILIHNCLTRVYFGSVFYFFGQFLLYFRADMSGLFSFFWFEGLYLVFDVFNHLL